MEDNGNAIKNHFHIGQAQHITGTIDWAELQDAYDGCR
ncbi:hypothetical protein CCC_03354 [Paramagnetospirillum magnetotacticum MS-1]|uniref:Uncharacterized protein n=1 Tax=Paramagnetospirillum magnetotacticum MS-1 TaxID=272627 RepID=A0A0C2V250_PARME|nr:hypothetical protein CCC_03354 [Paramagnetospirillum magnetotacticum MS-1]